MYQILMAYWKICRFQSGPQDLPTSQSLMIITLALYAVVGFLSSLFKLTPSQALLAAVVDVGLLLFLSYIVLWVRSWTVRWYQMVTAMAGAGSMLGLISIPIGAWFYGLGPESGLALFPSLVLVGLMVWNLFIVGHILRHALEIYFMFGAVLASVYMYIVLRVMTILFSGPQ